MSHFFDNMPQPANDEQYATPDNDNPFTQRAKEAGLTEEEYKARYKVIQDRQIEMRGHYFSPNEEVNPVIHAEILRNTKLTNEALTDALTGLPNRRAFEEEFKKKTTLERHQRKQESSLYIVILDIDHFKNINDTYGHPVGDHVLRCLASLLKEKIRGTDFVARFGGEEFIFLIENESSDEGTIHKIIERIRKSIEKIEVPLENASLKITASFGISVWKGNESCIREADQALYQSKKLGRNRISIYDPRSNAFSPTQDKKGKHSLAL